MGNDPRDEIVLRAGTLRVKLLPKLGGKIASLDLDGRELLQLPLASCAPRTIDMPFDASDASGWDECLPSVAPCSLETSGGIVPIPDHGDLWRVPWAPTAQSENAATLLGECFSLPLMLKRTITVSAAAKSHRLNLAYEVTNTGKSSVPWAWSAHPLFSVDAGDCIVLPGSILKLRLEGSTDGRLGCPGALVSWPDAELAGGGKTDLSLVRPPDSGIGDKLFAGPLAPGENWCTLERPSAGVRIRFEFDCAATPYLGLWICFGGWPQRPGPKQNCIALEPATAPVDSLAHSGPWSRRLEPSQPFSWEMSVDLDLLA